MRTRIAWMVAAALLAATPAFAQAGRIHGEATSHRVAAAPVEDMDCERTTDGDRAVTVCGPGERFTMTHAVTTDSDGDYTPEIHWEVDQFGSDIVCVQVCNVVCLPGQDCDTLTPSNCVFVTLTEDGSTADVLIERVHTASVKLEEGTPDDCDATECANRQALWVFDLENGGGCTATMGDVDIRILRTPIEVADVP